MEKHQRVETTSKKKILVNNFLGGIAWGVGATAGASIAIALFTLFLHQLNLIPFLGNFITDITSIVLTNLQQNPKLIQ